MRTNGSVSTNTVAATDVRPHATGEGELVVLCAANNYDSVKVADHHLAERLAAHAPVLYVDPPMSHLTARRNPKTAASIRHPRLRRTDAGFWRLTPVVCPFPLRRGMQPITEKIVRHRLGRAVRSLDAEVRVVINAWPQLDPFGTCRERLSVWWAQDDFAAGASIMGLDAERVRAGETARAAASDMVVAANPDVAARWRSAGYDVELIPYGADVESFATNGDTPVASGVELQAPVAVLVGQLNERTDPALLEALADRGTSLLLVGPASESASAWLPKLAARPNVTWVGGQPFEALPGLLALADVGLVPYTDSSFNRGSFPLKTLEYLAAGLPVVATDLPATRWLNAPPDFITIADGPADFADAVARAGRAGSSDSAREMRRQFARRHSYECRAMDFLRAIERRVHNRTND